ncbi:MAG TPA: aminotransferase class I/II-fold pyridoxal phosphate-dependent enzyme [Gaiellaceae bacterium]|nr:aminotransferase class I/II-fold pyridoxal phosphate-dependent enzyme [Gaiellaceae bacterium]
MRLDLPDFRLEVYLGEWEFKARHHLTASDAETMTVAELLALATPEEREAFDNLALGYVPVPGGEELREAIASTYEAVDAADVLTFAGAEEALFWALQELVGPDDHAIVTVPNYQSTESIPLAAGADLSGLLLRAENGWGLDLEELEGLLRPETRLVVVNWPNNPTGGVARPEDFRALVELCAERGIRLLSDEVYRGVELDPARTLPQAVDLSESALSLNVMSKAYGLPGLRIGWLACRDRELLGHLERRKHYTSICNAGPSEALATIALRNGERLRARTRETLAENLPLFEAFFAEWEELFEWEPPAGGCVCFPRYLGEESVEAFCRRLLDEAGVVLLPASIFASPLAEVPADRFRIGLGRKNPRPALDAFGEFLSGP